MKKLILKAKLKLLEMHFRAKSGHLGGNLSCIDGIMTLFHSHLKQEDQFILSKGHSAGALYVTLWTLGKLTDSDLETFNQDNTILPGHPSGDSIPGLLFSTGSLGHGPSLACGLALAAKSQKADKHVYCLCSDGEWQEGSCWEALTFSVHQKLDNLTIIIDQNGMQGFGSTEEVISCKDLSKRISAFDAFVVSANGHNETEIINALNLETNFKPKVIILNTLKGNGLHFEGKLESHYLPLTEDQYVKACFNLKNEID